MGILGRLFKRIVAALVLLVGISLPALADDALLNRLHAETYLSIENQITAEWRKSGSAALDLLLSRGRAALEAGEPAVALEHLTALVDHAPDFAEAYNARAEAYYLVGLTGPALDDIRQALVLNPQHFGAMRGMGMILHDIGRDADALAVYRQVHALHPQAPDALEAILRLELKLIGAAI
jgi:tetratricopeptide (TPR) repeat protein